jgi:hypothetical protein
MRLLSIHYLCIKALHLQDKRGKSVYAQHVCIHLSIKQCTTSTGQRWLLFSAAPQSVGYGHGFAEWLTLTSNIHLSIFFSPATSFSILEKFFVT